MGIWEEARKTPETKRKPGDVFRHVTQHGKLRFDGQRLWIYSALAGLGWLAGAAPDALSLPPRLLMFAR